MKILQKLKSDQSGIAHLGLILVVTAAIGVAGFVGYNIWQKNTSSAATASASKCGSGYKNTKKYSLYSTTSGSLKTTSLGYLVLFTKDSGSKTDWCAFTQRAGSAYGKKDWTYLQLVPTATSGASGGGRDVGNYSYYAGPKKSSNSKCVYIKGSIKYNGRYYSSYSWAKADLKRDRNSDRYSYVCN